MQNRPGFLEGQMEEYSSQVKSLRSYLKELSDTTAKHGTDREHFMEDLIEAEHNILYYEGEIARLQQELEESGPVQPSDTAKPAEIAKPRIKKPGILSLVLTPISFLAGALLGSRMKARRADKDN